MSFKDIFDRNLSWRRFGKSLTISTIEAIFQGKQELFEGLYLAGTEYDWPMHPVIHIDF